MSNAQLDLTTIQALIAATSSTAHVIQDQVAPAINVAPGKLVAKA